MNRHSPSWQILFRVAVYCLPFLALMVYDAGIMQRRIEMVAYDVTPSIYGMAANLLALDPWVTFHIPMYPHQELSVLVALAAGTDQSDFERFYWFGMLGQAILVALAGLWTVRLARRLNKGAGTILVLALLSASMPMMIIQATHWSNYFFQGLFSAPLGMALYTALRRERLELGDLVPPLFVLGILVANFFPAAMLVVALLVLIGIRFAHGHWRDWAEPVLTGPNWTTRWFAFPTVLLLTIAVNLWLPVYKQVFHAPTYSVDWRAGGPSIAIALAAAAVPSWVVVMLLRRLGKLGLGVQTVATPLLAGWLAAANIMAPYYVLSGATGLLSKRGAELQPDPAAGLLALLGNYPWLWLLVAMAAACLVLVITPGARRDAATNRALAAFALCSTALTALMAWRLTMVVPPLAEAPYDFGLVSRYYLSLLAPLSAITLAVGDRWRSRGAVLANGAIVAIAAASFLGYAIWLTPATENARQIDHDFGQAIDRFLAEEPQGQVFCMNTEAPRACNVLYSWNRYRKPEGMRTLSQTSLPGGRVTYTPRLNLSCDTRHDRGCWPDTQGKPTLVVFEGEPQDAPEDAKVIGWHRRFRNAVTVIRF